MHIATHQEVGRSTCPLVILNKSVTWFCWTAEYCEVGNDKEMNHPTFIFQNRFDFSKVSVRWLCFQIISQVMAFSNPPTIMTSVRGKNDTFLNPLGIKHTLGRNAVSRRVNTKVWKWNNHPSRQNSTLIDQWIKRCQHTWNT